MVFYIVRCYAQNQYPLSQNFSKKVPRCISLDIYTSTNQPT